MDRRLTQEKHPKHGLETALGVDGCAAGWLIASLGQASPKEADVRFELAARWDEVMDRLTGPGATRLIAVDMPIGLADHGPRGCDIAARKLLPKNRKSSVFPAPRRYMLGCADWAEANALGQEREGKGLSHQAWNIAGKIAEIDAVLTPADQERVIEAHPELIFHRLGGGEALPRKKEAEGMAARMALLRQHGLAATENWFGRFPRSQVARDDYLDAAACLLLARAKLQGRAARLPADPPRDSRGLRMEIWY